MGPAPVSPQHYADAPSCSPCATRRYACVHQSKLTNAYGFKQSAVEALNVRVFQRLAARRHACAPRRRVPCSRTPARYQPESGWDIGLVALTARAHAQMARVLLSTLQAKRQIFLAVQPFGPFVVLNQSFSMQQNVPARRTKPSPLLCGSRRQCRTARSTSAGAGRRNVRRFEPTSAHVRRSG